MAKKSDQSAGALDADNTEGLLAGLFAEENEFDRRALWRIGSWGVVTIGAVVIAVYANQTALGCVASRSPPTISPARRSRSGNLRAKARSRRASLRPRSIR